VPIRPAATSLTVPSPPKSTDDIGTSCDQFACQPRAIAIGMGQVEVPGNPMEPEEPVQGIEHEAALAGSGVGDDPEIARAGVCSELMQIFRHMIPFS